MGQEANATNNGCEACGELEIKTSSALAAADCTQCPVGQHGNSDRTVCFRESARSHCRSALLVNSKLIEICCLHDVMSKL